jgi:hypothetical protein
MTSSNLLTKLAICEYELRYLFYKMRAKHYFNKWMFDLDQEAGQKYGALKFKMVILKKVIKNLQNE